MRYLKSIETAVAAYVEQLKQDKFEFFCGLSICLHSNTHSCSSCSSTTSTNSQSSRVTAAAELSAASASLKYLRIGTEKRLALEEVCMRCDVEIAEGKLKVKQMIERRQNNLLLPADYVDTAENVQN